jgi:hypothetical protein
MDPVTPLQAPPLCPDSHHQGLGVVVQHAVGVGGPLDLGVADPGSRLDGVLGSIFMITFLAILGQFLAQKLAIFLKSQHHYYFFCINSGIF